MSQVLFYIHSQEDTDTNLPAHYVQACQLAAYYYQQNKKVFIYTENQQDAFVVDEYLWQFDGDSFVPHNLVGEGPRYGSPVEISWLAPQHPRAVLINLNQSIPKFNLNFQQIIDFVPAQEQLKINARMRYSAYKKLGHTLSTQDVEATSQESTNQTEDK
ncbi:DNA polymerase III subunit chi [Psychromonas sp. B3M02]|uniref:DNA polymerase III subunit chi n=1 Tax=unclassified Psychromonas TaxID=2614957 RepID=UPI000DE99DFA|nr:DNA polymerase III subunit chi [Psychromonas sp. B3M02]RBW43937.1 DNA polymerase III subunit chi [Psychromonas sp. B3M02]